MTILHQPRTTTDWKIAGTETFRRSSAALFKRGAGFKGFGQNLQNVDHHLLYLFQADLGKVLIQPDQSGAEALVVAYLCRPGRFRMLFENGIKPHTYVAMHLYRNIWPTELALYWLQNRDKLPMFAAMNPDAKPIGNQFEIVVARLCNTPIDKLNADPAWKPLAKLIKMSDGWENNKRYYFTAKTGCHSGNYGASFRVIQNGVLKRSEGAIVMSDQDAIRFTTLYHRELFPEIGEWHTELQMEIRKNHVIRNLFGFPYHFTGIVNDDTLRSLIAWIPQSTVGCITAIAYTKTQQFIEDNHKVGWDLLGDKHDSFLMQVPEGDEEEAKSVMQGFLCQTLIGRAGATFTMRSECAKGKNWGPFHETHNPNGMREF